MALLLGPTWAQTTEPALLASGSQAASDVSGAAVVEGLQSLTPSQLDRVLADYDKFDDNTKRQFKDALAKPNPFVIALLTSAANRIAPESRRQLADSIARVKAGK
ncbi:hypothetical protein DLREEDagrD3_16480 [Denitratisoma sp. agr-D3]